jgi:hypothetical protein
MTALAGIYCISVVVYAIAGSKHLIPNLIPDEFFYGKLAQGLAFGDGLQWRGSGWGLPPLWPTLLSLAWHGGSVPHGYAVAKVMGSVLVSTTVIPVWLLGRTLVGPRLALVPAALSVMGAWMLVTEFVASENLAYPLATASLASTVMAMRDTRARWMVISVLFAIFAGLTRTQMLVLPVILVVALVLDVLRQPRDQRRARIAARPRALWVGLIVVVLGGLLAFVVKPDLTNYAVLAHHTDLGRVIRTTGRHAVSSVVMFAFIPVAVVLALMARPANWRDDRLGPVLVTLTAAVLVLYPLLGRFEAWATRGSPVDRYAMYLAPLLFIALMLAPGRIGRRTSLVAALAVVALLFGAPVTNNYIEQPALFGIQKRLYDLAPFFQHHLTLGVVLVALPITLAGAFALTSHRRAGAGLAAAVGLVAGVMLVQSYTSANAEISTVKRNRQLIVPNQLDWVDRYANGPVAVLAVGKNLAWRSNADIYTEFFNRKVKWYYSTLDTGNGACDIDLKARGFVKLGANRCPQWPRNWVLSAGPVKITLWGQQFLAGVRSNGILVRTPPGPPRVLGLVEPPCSDYVGCTGALQLGFYLDDPARVSVSFGATATQHRIQTGSVIRTLPAGKPTTLNFKIPKGDQAVNLPVDWSDPRGAPELRAVVVRSGGVTYRLY